MPSTLKITINHSDWNEQLKGWNCNALSVSCLSVVSVRVNGVTPDPSFYVLEKENNLIRWTQPQLPEELVLLVKPVIDGQEDAEKSKQVKLDTVLKFAAVVIPALIAAVSTITVTVINTKKDSNTEKIQQLSQTNQALSEQKDRLVLHIKDNKATIDSLSRLLPKDINKQLVIVNDSLKKETSSLKGQLEKKTSKIALLEKQLISQQSSGQQPGTTTASNSGYKVFIHSSTKKSLFVALDQKLRGAGFLSVNYQGLSAEENQIVYYQPKAEAVARNAARIISQCCGLSGMTLVLRTNADREKEIQIEIR